jgi:hypothetical protein
VVAEHQNSTELHQISVETRKAALVVVGESLRDYRGIITGVPVRRDASVIAPPHATGAA